MRCRVCGLFLTPQNHCLNQSCPNYFFASRVEDLFGHLPSTATSITGESAIEENETHEERKQRFEKFFEKRLKDRETTALLGGKLRAKDTSGAITLHHLGLALAIDISVALAKSKSKEDSEDSDKSRALGVPRLALVFTVASGKVRPSKIHLALDSSAENPGHTPLVSLIQHMDGTSDSFVKFVYLNYHPSDADLGIFIEQMSEAKSRLVFWDREQQLLAVCNPSKIELLNMKKVYDFSAERALELKGQAKGYEKKPLVTCDLQEENIHKGSYIKALGEESLDRIIYKAAIPALHAAVEFPVFTPTTSEYTSLKKKARFVFDSIFLLTAYVLASPLVSVSKRLITPKLEDHPHQIGALLVSAKGQLLSWGVDISPVMHAETSTVKLLCQGEELSKTLLDNSRLYTSLEPCFMCAGLLSEFGRAYRMAVVFGQVDPAVHQKNIQGSLKKATDTILKWNSDVKEVMVDAPYKNATQGFSSILEKKRQTLHFLHSTANASAKPTEKNKYVNSATQAIMQGSYARTLVKALLELCALKASIAQDSELDNKVFLSSLIDQVLAFLVKATDSTDRDALLKKAATLLDGTRGKNVYLNEQEEYKNRTRGDSFLQKIQPYLST